MPPTHSTPGANVAVPGNAGEFDVDAFWRQQADVYKREVGDEEEKMMWRPPSDAPAPPTDPAPAATTGPATWTTASGQNLLEMLGGAIEEYDTRQKSAGETKEKEKRSDTPPASKGKGRGDRDKDDKERGKQGG